MLANIPDRRHLHHRRRLTRRLLLSITIAGTSSIATQAGAQNYPWCSNFADGAGTNCGFSTLEQCRAVIMGSGGYCDRNNLYKPTGTPAPTQRKALKNHARKSSSILRIVIPL